VVDSATLAAQVSAGRDELLVMDARTPERFRGEKEPIDPVAGRVPGAVNLPLGLNLGADGRFRSAEELRALYAPVIGGRRLDQVVAMCGSGVTACHNLLAMAIAGLDGGRLYAGSWSEWIRDPARPVARG
jgi:thiosulfate/3-mercaptopyruvate sulfurtransferase